MTQTQAISEQTRALSQTGDHQAKAAQLATEKQTAELEKQRQVVTAFTILTTLFLPLGFCASVGFQMAQNPDERLTNGGDSILGR